MAKKNETKTAERPTFTSDAPCFSQAARACYRQFGWAAPNPTPADENGKPDPTGPKTGRVAYVGGDYAVTGGPQPDGTREPWTFTLRAGRHAKKG